MPAQHLARGMTIIVDGRPYALRGSVNGDLIHLEAADDGSLVAMTRETIAEGICRDRIRIPVSAPQGVDAGVLAHKLEQDLVGVPEPVLAEMKRRFAYLGALERLGITERKPTPEALLASAQEVGDSRPPSSITVYRWRAALEAAHGDIRALLPAYARRGNRRRRLDGEVLKVIQQVIQERYLNPAQPTTKVVHDGVWTELRRINANRLPADKLKLPTLRTIQREIKRLDKYDVAKARIGKRAADILFRPTGSGPEASRPLHRVEMDHTLLNIIVVDEKLGLPLGRPWITSAIDAYSRMPVGIHIGFDPPSWKTVMSCLREAIRPKTDLKERYPSIVNSWPCYGVPDVLVVDNGMDFHAESLELACLQLNIDLQYSPRRCPWYKGKIERHFRTLDTDFLRGTAGYTFPSIADRGDYNSAKEALLPDEVLKEALYKWIVDVYANDAHRGLRGVPAERWRQGEAEYGVRLPSNAQDLNITLSSTIRRSVFAYGVELWNLRFNSSELGALRRRLGPKDVKVVIRYDPSDLSSVYAIDPQTNSPIPLTFSGPEDYVRGLHLCQHRQIARHARTASGKADMEALLAAREDIRRIIHESMISTKKVAKRARLARVRSLADGPPIPMPDEVAMPSPPMLPPSIPLPSEFNDDDQWEADFGIKIGREYL